MKKTFSLPILLLSLMLSLTYCSNSELTKAQTENKKLNELYNNARVEIAKLTAEQEFNKKELERLTKELTTLKQEFEKVSKQRDELLVNSTGDAARLKMLDERFKELQKQIQLLEKQKTTLEAQAQKLKMDSDREYKQTATQLQKAEAQLLVLKEKLLQAEAERKRLTEEAGRTRTTAQTGSIDSRIETIRKDIAAKEAEINALKAALEKMQKEMENQKKVYEQLIEKLKKEIQSGTVQTSLNGREVRMVFKDKILFASGSTEINATGRNILNIVGQELKNLSYGLIYVEGHTDSDRVVAWRIKQIYPTNWEFSVIRAVRVVRFFVERIGIQPEKVIAAGRSQYVPSAPNVNNQGKALNRRIEILIMPERKIVQGQR